MTDIGKYPTAKHHLRKRERGCKQHILVYCISGKGWVKHNNKTKKICKNQFFLILPDYPHSYGADQKDPWSIYWLHFAGKKSSFFSNMDENLIKTSSSTVARMDDRLLLFEEIFQNLEMGYSIENLIYANLSLWHFLASLKFISQFRQVKRNREVIEMDVIEKSIYFMKDNINSSLTLMQIAEQSGLSSSHFSSLFRKKTGHAPIDYFIHLKIQKACQLLDTTSMRINELSLYLDYEDPYYFSRLFTKVMGISPTAYRKVEKG